MNTVATPDLSPQLLRRHPYALGTALCVGLFASHPLFGALLFAVAPFVSAWAIHTAVRIAQRPHERRTRGILLAVWVVAIAVPAALHADRAHAARADATAAIAAVDDYRVRRGRYPESLAEAGLDAAALQSRWRLWYRVVDGKPALHYRSTLLIFDVYSYDFVRREWRRHYD